jgi:thioredoxin-dependent peroxiredoxin
MTGYLKRLLVSSLGLAAVGSYLVLGASAQQPMAGQPELKVGEVAPDFTLQATDGNTYTLSKLRGKTVVLAWFPKAFTAG